MFSLCLLICLCALPIFANQGSVVIRENVEISDRDSLAQKLRAITGLPDLKFDQKGILQLGTRASTMGSASARELLAKAVAGPSVIVLEDASSRPDVAFCQVFEARSLLQTTYVLPIFVVEIDFEDFGRVMGDKQARAAFDVGWAVLHEVDHVVMDSVDPNRHGIAGECEESINKMRREVGLPVRMDYFFSSLPYTPDSHLVSRLVRLRFEEVHKTKKVKSYWIIWDAAIVGGLPDARIATAF